MQTVISDLTIFNANRKFLLKINYFCVLTIINYKSLFSQKNRCMFAVSNHINKQKHE